MQYIADRLWAGFGSLLNVRFLDERAIACIALRSRHNYYNLGRSITRLRGMFGMAPEIYRLRLREGELLV